MALLVPLHWAIGLSALAAAATAAAPWGEQLPGSPSASAAALAEDDECLATGTGDSSDCALNALQLREKKLALHAPAGAGTGSAARSAERIRTLITQGSGMTAPAGVNLGGWLCLEDWFFSGTSGFSVATGDDFPGGQGACLPPEVVNVQVPWPSEGVLGKRLSDEHGAYKAAEAFTAHRHSFIGNTDLDQIASLGIRTVRVPITWTAFADALAPISSEVYASHNADWETVMVPDPFYSGTIAMPTIPRAWLAQLLKRAEERRLKVLWDVHAMPGGSSQGTYNGIWPDQPKFWTSNASIGNTSVPLYEAGMWISKAMIHWLESLDDLSLRSVAGVSFMNEPAHMLSAAKSAGNSFANEEQILSFLEDSADLFRKSKLPGAGVKLYVQVIETAFEDFNGTVAPWYHRTFSREEQHTWAVMDRHMYTAWNAGVCDGRVVNGGAYLCDQPLDEVRPLLNWCVRHWAAQFKELFPGLRACSEFSVGTYDKARLACDDPSVTNMLMEEEVKGFYEYGIEPFFWTWKMPYGQVFEPGWSLQYVAGLEGSRPAEACSPAYTAATGQ